MNRADRDAKLFGNRSPRLPGLPQACDLSGIHGHARPAELLSFGSRIPQPKNRPGPAVSVRPDPTKPMSTWRTAWRSLTKEAGLAGLRFHDLRHHAITELAESSASDQGILSSAALGSEATGPRMWIAS